MAYLNVAKLSDALNQMKSEFGHFNQFEKVPLKDSKSRILYESVIAKENIPAFDRSMVDGYAVRFEDTLGASPQSPILLEYLGEVEMGMCSNFSLQPNQAVYVPTGGAIPHKASAMVMVEYTERIGGDVVIYQTSKHGEHIVSLGEDVHEEEVVLEKGINIQSQHMAILASLGYWQVKVYKKVKVAIISTGNELVDVSEVPKLGQVRDCNQSIIESLLESSHCQVVKFQKAEDSVAAFEKAIEEGLKAADMVILSGGSSAGAKDLTEEVLKPHLMIHGLAIKPGKPTIIASKYHKPVIGLPGHPAACFITLKALVEPFIRSWVGWKERIHSIPCVSNFQMHAASGRDLYQLVKLSRSEESVEWKADILYGKSGMVSALAEANAYIVLPMSHEGILVGDLLNAYLL